MPDLGYEAKRLVDVGRALRLARTLAAHERLTRAQLERLQRERVDAIVRHAVAGSAFYRERLPVGDGPIELGRLPTLDKATIMEHFDHLACDRRLWAGECERRAGVHLFEDLTVVENVDEDGRPVPDGEPGARLLVTSLFNRVQPLIRFEVPDLVTVDPEPCPCGRPLRRMRAIEGRADDVISIDGVVVLPAQFAVVTADRDVREFQVVQEGERLRLRVALRDGAPAAEASARLRERVATRLWELGVRAPQVRVETCAGIERPAGGKLRMVVAGDPPSR